MEKEQPVRTAGAGCGAWKPAACTHAKILKGETMKKRIEKKKEKRRRDKIHELLDLTLDINSTMPREQEKTGNQPTAFFDFSGHIGTVELKVIREG